MPPIELAIECLALPGAVSVCIAADCRVLVRASKGTEGDVGELWALSMGFSVKLGSCSEQEHETTDNSRRLALPLDWARRWETDWRFTIRLCSTMELPLGTLLIWMLWGRRPRSRNSLGVTNSESSEVGPCSGGM